jgi:hypothetical protein
MSKRKLKQRSRLNWNLANAKTYAMAVDPLLQHGAASRLELRILNSDSLPIVHFRRDAGQQHVK